MQSVAANIYINSMKLENTAAVILSYVLLVCIFLGGHYSLPCWLAHGLTSTEVLFKSVNQSFIRSTTDLFQSIGMALRNLKSDDCSYISATECFSIV